MKSWKFVVISHPHRSILGAIPDHWDIVPLQKVLARSASGDWGDDAGAVAIPVLRSTNFTGNRSLDFADVEVRRFSADRASRFDIRAGDLLIERSGGGPGQPVGRIVRVADDLPGFGYSNFVQLLRVDASAMVPDFVAWCLYELHRSGGIERLQHQTTQMRNLDFRDYLQIRLPRPSLDVQAQIARQITAADEAAKQTDRELQALKRAEASLFHHLLERGAPASGRDWVETKIGIVPTDWDIVPLHRVADIDAGVTLNSDRSPRQRAYRYLTVINVQRGWIDEGEPRYLELWDSEVPRKLLAPGDILVVEGHANSTEIGRAALVENAQAGLTFQNHLFRVRVTDSEVDPRFLIHALNSENARRHWAAVCNTSSGLNTINQRQLRRMLIPKPSLDEQRAILRYGDASHAATGSLGRERSALKRLQRGFLQNLLIGRELQEMAAV